MKLLHTLAVLGLASAANAWAQEWKNHTEVVTYTTLTTDIYTTFCPSPTTFTYGTKTYTVTEATTVTITECPCTYSRPVPPPYHSPPPSSPPPPPPPPPPSPPTTTCVSQPPGKPSPPPPYSNSTRPHPPPPPPLPPPPPPPHSYTTVVVTEYTTFCPSPTTITQGSHTIIVSESSTTVTITNCPCTISYIVPPPVTPTSPHGVGTVSVTKTTSLAQFTGNSANKQNAGYGAIAAAGLAAILL